MSYDQLTFLPFFRWQHHELALTGSGDSKRLTVVLKLRAQSRGVAGGVPGREYVAEHRRSVVGPGDVAIIDPELFSRVEPPANSQDGESNYFAFVESADPGVFWQFSLSASGEERVQPWLALIVLTAAELRSKHVSIQKTQDGRKLINVPASMLPKSEDGSWDWASAHVQLDGFDPSVLDEIDHEEEGWEDKVYAKYEDFATQHPTQVCSRLFCLRKLDAETSYMAAVVPYYQASLPNAGESNASAFTTDATLSLLVYHSWAFKTAERGDFESLSRELKRLPADKAMGEAAADASPNFEEGEWANQFILCEGALARPGFTGLGGSEPLEHPRIEYGQQLVVQDRTEIVRQRVNLGLTDPGRMVLEDLSCQPEEEDPGTPDPLLTMPYYGRRFSPSEDLEGADAEGDWPQPSSWKQEINLDFRHRLAAGLGTQIVRRNQEKYLKEAWGQVGDIRLANEKLRMARTAIALSQKINAKYLQPLTDERFVLRSRAGHLHVAESESGMGTSLKGRLGRSGLSHGLVQPTFSRLAHRTIGLANADLFEPWRVAEGHIGCLAKILCAAQRLPIAAVQGLSWIAGQVHRTLRSVPGARSLVVKTRRVVLSVDGGETRWDWHELRNFGAVLVGLQARANSAAAGLSKMLRGQLCGSPRTSNRPHGPFAARVKTEFSRIAPFVQAILEPKLEIVTVRPIKIATEFKPRFDVTPVIQRKVRTAICFNDPGRKVSETLDPLRESPSFSDRLYRRLAEISAENVLPGVSDLPLNSITLGEENRRFIESVAVGACQAVNDELAFNGFPVDWQGSPFRHFWDPTRIVAGQLDDEGQPEALPDFKEIKDFAEGLGLNALVDETERARLTIILKGDLIRRYPDTIFYAVVVGPADPADGPVPTWAQANAARSQIPIEIHQPVFRAELGPDVVAVGLPLSMDDTELPDRSIYVAFEQPRELPVFGLDVTSDRVDPCWDDVSADSVNGYVKYWQGLAEEGDTDDDGKIKDHVNSAWLAARTFQKPMRVLIHVRELLRERS